MSAPSERGLSGKVSDLNHEPTAGELGIADGPSDEYRSGPSEPTADYPPLREIRAHVCAACIAREGSECHTPGCLFWLHSVEDLPPNLDIYVDPPADLPATLASVDDVATVCRLAGLSQCDGGWRGDEPGDDVYVITRKTAPGVAIVQGVATVFSGAPGSLLHAAIQTARVAS